MNWPQVCRPETEIHWGPWVAQLGHLVRSGWECRIDEHDYMRTRLMYLRSRELDAVGISEHVGIDDQFNSLGMGGQRLRINMRLHQNINIHTMEMPSEAVTTHDVQMGFMTNPVTFNIHYYFGKDTPEEIVVEPQTVAQMLDTIREMQSPDAKALLHSQRLREGTEAPTHIVDTRLSAKILTFAR